MNNVNYILNELRLDGNNLCLNFINTIFDRYADEIRDLVTDKEDWIAWIDKLGLNKSPHTFSNNASFDLKSIIETRELFYRIFYSLLQKRTVLKKDLKQFERLILKKQKATKLFVINGQPNQKIEIDSDKLNDFLLPIIESAQELFISNKIERIKECSYCGWLFFDGSKNKSRKWCSMDTCGSQIKAKRYYQGKKKEKNEN